VTINEFAYDTAGTDAREFVELYNSGPGAVDISGWSVGGHDNANPAPHLNTIVTIPGAVGSGTTMLAAGGYYVIGNAGVTNVNQVVASGVLENDSETIDLFDGAFNASGLVDALVYEGFRGPTAGAGASYGDLATTLTVDETPQVGPATVRGVYTLGDSAGTLTSIARYTDGSDSNNNGKDFGMRPATPGVANLGATITSYVVPNINALNDGDLVPGLSGGFVGARAMTPSVAVDGLNQYAIADPPGGATKVVTTWDGAGGGNGVVADATFAGGAQKFDIYAYIDTEDLPQSVNGTGVFFTGSEFSFFGLAGSIDGSVGAGAANLSNISGLVTNTGDSSVGNTGVAWYYEKIQLGASEKLYLVDSGDGGNMNADPANATAEEWTVLQTIDLTSTASGWYRLSIQIDAAGNGVARFDNQTFNFATTPGLYGSFYTGYRENTQDGADTVPAYLRGPTFTQFVGGADADFDDSGTVDGKDFLIWQANTGGPGTPATGDATGDGQVNNLDFDQWKLKFGGPPAVAAGGAVPEPAAGLMAIVTLLGTAAARRRG
jgi:hypothetical protein